MIIPLPHLLEAKRSSPGAPECFQMDVFLCRLGTAGVVVGGGVAVRECDRAASGDGWYGCVLVIK